jgi:hypothetical protein
MLIEEGARQIDLAPGDGCEVAITQVLLPRDPKNYVDWPRLPTGFDPSLFVGVVPDA